MIINGLGQTGEVSDPLIGKGGGETGFLRLHLYMITPDTNNKLQRFRILRSHHYPENIILNSIYR
jgi:hypothetical protein